MPDRKWSWQEKSEISETQTNKQRTPYLQLFDGKGNFGLLDVNVGQHFLPECVLVPQWFLLILLGFQGCFRFFHPVPNVLHLLLALLPFFRCFLQKAVLKGTSYIDNRDV